jgi:serine/threonine-protein kinase
MALSARTRLGPYEILSALGAGGMGEVYRARDTRLNRNVAIKVLPELFAGDPERLARFHREAQVLAALNHPNIAHIHGVEDSGGVRALVLELVEGPTLAERIEQGPLPLAEAVPIAKQMAEALAAAHEQGVIHRDLKPANVKVREDGTVKVLDFGLARLVAPDASTAVTAGLTQSPTLTTPAATLAGVILGTAAYMSPEQAKGRPADKRSDVWAFGAVVYEMLTGRRPFEGEDLADTLATVLKSDPDWNALPVDVPPHIRLLIQRCLAKDKRHRIADMSVALFVLNEAAGLAPAGTSVDAPPPRWRRIVAPAAAAIVAGAAVGTAVWLTTRAVPGTQVRRFEITPTGPAALVIDAQSIDIAITGDGTRIVYKGATTSGPRLFVRSLDQLEPAALTISGVPRAPFLSPDGQWVGFVDTAPLSIRRVAITGGPVLQVCPLDGASRGISWGEDDTIVFATASPLTGLLRVPAGGGEAAVLTRPDRDRGEADHAWPQFLPGRQAVLFTIVPSAGGVDASQVVVLDLRTGTQKVLLRGGSQARYVPSGHLVYAASGTLRAVAFDLARMEVVGTARPVVAEVVTLPTGTAEFDIAGDGTLIYAAGGGGITAAARTIAWVDRQGREEPIKAPPRPYVVPRLSPDGTRVALSIADQDNDIWVWSLAGETLTRVTSDPAADQAPVWMPDGRRIVFASQSGGAAGNIFWQAADGTSAAEQLTDTATAIERPSSVSPDGTRIVFWQGAPTTGNDVMMLTLGKERKIEPLVQTPFFERNGDVSPDGRWLAYESNESGQFEVFVRPFPDTTKGRWQVSTGGGGAQPLWARNGQELFYLAADGGLMRVPVTRASEWAAGAPARVLEGRYYRGLGFNVPRSYDVSLDGKRFLIIKPAGLDPSARPASIVVVQNWLEELKRLVPVRR